MDSKRWHAVVLLMASVAVAGIVVASVTSPRGDATPGEGRPPVSALSSTGPPAPSLVVIGDSFVTGSDMNSGPTWTRQLALSTGWDITELAVRGSGYLAAGLGTDFSDRISITKSGYADVDYVVLAGGRNDVGAFPVPEIVRAAQADIRDLRTTIDGNVILLSPFSSGNPGKVELELTRQLRAMARELGVPFIDVTRMVPETLIGSDDVHPTDEGHALLAISLEKRLRQLVFAPNS